MDCWHEHPGFSHIARGTWESLQVNGCTGFALKEKLKMLKNALKEWNKTVFGNLDVKIERAVEKSIFFTWKVRREFFHPMKLKEEEKLLQICGRI